MGSFPASHGADYLRLFEDSISHQHPIVFDIFCTGRVDQPRCRRVWMTTLPPSSKLSARFFGDFPRWI